MKVSTATEKALKKAKYAFDRNSMIDPTHEKGPHGGKNKNSPLWMAVPSPVGGSHNNGQNGHCDFQAKSISPSHSRGSYPHRAAHSENNLSTIGDKNDSQNQYRHKNQDEYENGNENNSYGLLCSENEIGSEKKYGNGNERKNDIENDGLSTIGSVVGVERNPLITAIKNREKKDFSQ